MSEICSNLHNLFSNMKRYTFPFDKNSLPKNGIYILFEKNEFAHGTDRIVRIGTHRGNDRLISRLNEHFLIENKDRSIFRKNIGRAILNREDKSYLEQWNLDLTSRVNRNKYSSSLDFEKQNLLEQRVTNYIQTNFSFSIIPEPQPSERIKLESKIIATISNCTQCSPSSSWIGNFSPIQKIKDSGLWQIQGLYKSSFTDFEFLIFKSKYLLF